MKYKLVIFDMDGTILNTLNDLANSCNAVLKQFGFPCHSLEEIKYFVGNGIPKLIERAIPDGLNNPKYEEVLNSFIKYYGRNSSNETKPYDKVTELIKMLRNNKVTVCVNTNKLEEAAVDLNEKYFPGLIDFTSGGRFNRNPKPCADGVKEIMSKVPGITLKETVFIGDSDVDIQTGKNAGCDAIGVSWGFRGKEFLLAHGAEKVADSVEELIEMLS